MKKILFLTLILISCGDKHDFEIYLKDVDIDFADKYEINFIRQEGLNDWTLESEIIVSKNDRNRLLKKLKKRFDFKYIKSKQKYFEELDKSKDSAFGFVFGSKYCYNLHRIRYSQTQVSGYENYDIELDTISNQFNFTYSYE